MPLDQNLPSIDNRRFDDILAEIRTRIPRYTPEWTDLNDNDPGIALSQLFAWLSEMLLYRLENTPKLNYIKFLQLLGIELKPAEPAIADITFPVLETHSEPFVIVPKNTQVTADAATGDVPLVFETERTLMALTAKLVAVQVFDGYAFSDLSLTNDQTAESYEPFGPLANAESALMLGFRYNGEFPEVELSLAVYASEATAELPAFSCDLPETQFFPSAEIVWQYWNGREWRNMTLLEDETRAFTRSGYIFLKSPNTGEMEKTVFAPATESLYWIRAHLQRGYEKPPKITTIRTNTVTAVQAESVFSEILGGSDGSPNQQQLVLENVPVLAGTLELEIDQGEGFERWTEVGDLFGSTAKDRHYVLNRTTGQVTFGDGVNGDIPVANPDNPGGNVVARRYRFGGGKIGNVTANTITSLQAGIDGIDENGISNLRAAHSGQDEESLEEAQLRAPQSLKSKCRAVTAEDFEQLAKAAANVRRAKALPLYHPNFPDTNIPGVITVVIAPDSDDPKPIPSEGTLRTVCAYLNQRRLLTTEVIVTQPTYRQVEIHGDVVAKNDADLSVVSQAIEQGLLDYFHPLKGGEDGQGWPFGRDIFYSLVYQRIFAIEGVDRIESLTIFLDGEAQEAFSNLEIKSDVLLYSSQHSMQVRYSFDE